MSNIDLFGFKCIQIQLNANNGCNDDVFVESGMEQVAKNIIEAKDDQSNGLTMDIENESDVDAISFCDDEEGSFDNN